MNNLQRSDSSEQSVLQLLSQRFGSGEIYLTNRAQRALLDLAMQWGWVNLDGFLTPAGRLAWARASGVR